MFEFERVTKFPRKVKTSIGDWTLLQLANRSTRINRYPGTTVVDGYTIAFASESPLFHLRNEGPLVQKQESVVIVVESGSMYRTNVLKEEDPEWPGPDSTHARDYIKYRPKALVHQEMFMRSGPREPLEGYDVNTGFWTKVIDTQWMFRKAPSEGVRCREWELEYPVSESVMSMGAAGSRITSVKWLCTPPPAGFSPGPRWCEKGISQGPVDVGPVRLDCTSAVLGILWNGEGSTCYAHVCSHVPQNGCGPGVCVRL